MGIAESGSALQILIFANGYLKPCREMQSTVQNAGYVPEPKEARKLANPIDESDINKWYLSKFAAFHSSSQHVVACTYF
jgi:hypothetical protein